MHKIFTRLLTFCGLALPLAGWSQVNLSTINTAIEQNFNTLASTGTAEVSTLPTGWTFIETGTNANTTYAAGTGSSNAGNTYSLGLDAADRALGGLQSGSLIPTLGASFTNNTGTTITGLRIRYAGEQWRLGASGRGADRLDFQYSLNATALNNGTWVDVNELDFNSPVTTGTVGALDGNHAANRTVVEFTIGGLTLAPGASFAVRWNDFNVSGADDGLGIDDFSLTPQGTDPLIPTIISTATTVSFGQVLINQTSVKTYQIKGANLTGGITTTVSGAAYSISLDGVTFGNSLVLPDSGALVYVRLAPTSNGIINDSIYHSSTGIFKTVRLSGNGFDPVANLISIGQARTQSTGTFVSVAGRVTVANEQGNPAYIQDATGGIPVFFAPLASSVQIGDSVQVYGPIGLFNDQKQISGSGIVFTRINTASRIITPKPISLSEMAANEGLLVTVQNVSLVNKSFVFYPQSTETITDGTTSGDLRIDGDTNLPGLTKPQGVTNITGVVGRFRTNAQLLPRFREDVPGANIPTTTSDSIGREATLDIINWNFEFFGARIEDYGQEYGPADEALQLINIKTVLDSLNADIIAVQEVSDQQLFAQLASQLGRYSYRCSDRYSYSFNGPDNTFPPQKVCFLYDTTTIKVLDARAMFAARYDSARTIDGSLLPGYPTGDGSSFWSSGRLPYLLTVEAAIQGVTEKIHLVDIHAKSGSTAADRTRRAYDAQVLKDTLDAQFAGEKLIILGDYNDDLDVSIAGGATTPYAPFVNDSAYVAITRALSLAGARSTVSFNDVIDHQVISASLANDFLVGSQRVVTPFGYIPNYATTTSDHLPVLSRFRFTAPAIQFVSRDTTVQENFAGAISVAYSLSKPFYHDQQVVIQLAGNATPGADYTTTPSANNNNIVLTIPAGVVGGNLTLQTFDDNVDEANEQATLTLTAGTGVTIGTKAAFALTIVDNDVPTIAFAERSASAEEGSGTYTVQLPLSGPVATAQTITIRIYHGLGAYYGSDYITDPTPTGQTLTVNVPAGSTTASFTITPLADHHCDLRFEPVIFRVTGVSDGLVLGASNTFVFTIIDVRREIPKLGIFPNPTLGPVVVFSPNVPDYTGTISATVRSASGDLIYSGQGSLLQLSQALSNALTHARRGTYYVQLQVEGTSSVIRVLKL